MAYEGLPAPRLTQPAEKLAPDFDALISEGHLLLDEIERLVLVFKAVPDEWYEAGFETFKNASEAAATADFDLEDLEPETKTIIEAMRRVMEADKGLPNLRLRGTSWRNRVEALTKAAFVSDAQARELATVYPVRGGWNPRRDFEISADSTRHRLDKLEGWRANLGHYHVDTHHDHDASPPTDGGLRQVAKSESVKTIANHTATLLFWVAVVIVVVLVVWLLWGGEPAKTLEWMVDKLPW